MIPDLLQRYGLKLLDGLLVTVELVSISILLGAILAIPVTVARLSKNRGLYHVLGGALSPIDGVDAEDLKIAELLTRVGRGGIDEVVLATNPTTTGEATALHIAERLRGQVTVTRLASGLPVGADLEHADEVTLGKALAGRHSLG